MNDTVQVTKKCKMCGVSFIPSGAQANCEICKVMPGEAHKAANQLKKAFRVSNHLAKHGVSSVEAARYSTGTWNSIGELVDAAEPSEITKALAITLLAGVSVSE